jgi:hypothetical protein
MHLGFVLGGVKTVKKSPYGRWGIYAVDALGDGSLRLLPEPLYYRAHHILVATELTAFLPILVHPITVTGSAYREIVRHLPAHVPFRMMRATRDHVGTFHADEWRCKCLKGCVNALMLIPRRCWSYLDEFCIWNVVSHYFRLLERFVLLHNPWSTAGLSWSRNTANGLYFCVHTDIAIRLFVQTTFWENIHWYHETIHLFYLTRQVQTYTQLVRTYIRRGINKDAAKWK